LTFLINLNYSKKMKLRVAKRKIYSSDIKKLVSTKLIKTILNSFILFLL
jgi:hypothetical protein